jgi:hypothetical protein
MPATGLHYLIIVPLDGFLPYHRKISVPYWEKVGHPTIIPFWYKSALEVKGSVTTSRLSVFCCYRVGTEASTLVTLNQHASTPKKL